VLFGNELIELLPEDVGLNLSSFAGYLPTNASGEVDGVTFYEIFGVILEPQALILQAIIFVSIVTIVISIITLITRKGLARRLFSFVLLGVTVGSAALFIYTYGLNLDATLWADINNFFTSVFSIGLLGGTSSESFGAFAVFSTYLMISGLGTASFIATQINK
jgi:hypothetical protein